LFCGHKAKDNIIVEPYNDLTIFLTTGFHQFASLRKDGRVWLVDGELDSVIPNIPRLETVKYATQF
jgi:hypothetical protein